MGQRLDPGSREWMVCIFIRFGSLDFDKTQYLQDFLISYGKEVTLPLQLQSTVYATIP